MTNSKVKKGGAYCCEGTWSGKLALLLLCALVKSSKTDTLQVEKQRGHLAAYHGLSKTEDQAIDSDEVCSSNILWIPL